MAEPNCKVMRQQNTRIKQVTRFSTPCLLQGKKAYGFLMLLAGMRYLITLPPGSLATNNFATSK